MVILFIALVVIIWLRLLAIFVLVMVDHARSRRLPAGPAARTLTDVGIVVPAYDEAAIIHETLDSVRTSVMAGAALIVVDDGSSDQTEKIVKARLSALGCGRLIRHERNLGKAAALNTGIAALTTPFVLTLDADTVVSGEAVARAAELLRRADAAGHRYAVVAFDVSVEPSDSLFAELQGVEYDASLNFERRGQAMIHAVSVAPGAASLWRIADLRAIGGFCGTTVTEDVDATLRLAAIGRRAAHCPGARAFTKTPKTFMQLLAQRRRWCLGHYQGIGRLAKYLGGDLVFTILTYPNFFLLSAFLPLMCILSLLTLFAKAGLWITTLGWLTALWLMTVYVQRLVALRLMGRDTRITAFLIEPFSTQLFHFCAMALVIYASVRQALGVSHNLWATRAR